MKRTPKQTIESARMISRRALVVGAVQLGAVETGFLACLLLVAVPGCTPSAADLESVPVWSRAAMSGEGVYGTRQSLQSLRMRR